ncbi:MAG: hypothetical protein PsegKO_27950 [Pseudohongiellaceae bacterium]
MNEQKFRERLCFDAYQPDPDLLELAAQDKKLKAALNETLAQNHALDMALTATEAPPHLHYRLLRIADEESPKATPNRKENRFTSWLTTNTQSLALAASVALVVGLTVGMLIGNDSSVAEQAFGRQIVMHLSHEVPELQYINAGSLNTEFNLSEINSVLNNAGFRLRDDQFQAEAPVRYAKNCIVDPAYTSAHLILQTEDSPVNVIVINNKPVRRQFQFGDENYSGQVIPMSSGNLILVAKKNIDLEFYNEIIADQVEWNS